MLSNTKALKADLATPARTEVNARVLDLCCTASCTHANTAIVFGNLYEKVPSLRAVGFRKMTQIMVVRFIIAKRAFFLVRDVWETHLRWGTVRLDV